MTDHRVIVVSIPKSGTYLVAEVLKALGFGWTGMHLAESAYTDYRGSNLDDARRDPGRFLRSDPLNKSLERIGAGEFAVGHLPFKPDVVEAIGPFKRLYATRDLRTALISYMRFMQSTGRLGARHLAWYSVVDPRKKCELFLQTSAPSLLKRFYEGMVGWSNEDAASSQPRRRLLPVRFEELTSEPAQAVRVIESIAAFLGIPDCNARGIRRSSRNAETITKSDGLTRLDDYWSPQAEKCFLEIGGAELNAALGNVEPSYDRQAVRRREAA
jgi:hypothetical protein